MGSVTITGKDILTLNSRILRDVADGDWAKLEFDDDIGTMKVSKDGNAIYADSQQGYKGRLSMRILLGSSDDKFLNSALAQWRQNSSGFVLMAGSLTKRVGDGLGNVTNESYQYVGGQFKKMPSIKSNSDGDTEQSVRVYEINVLVTGTPIQ